MSQITIKVSAGAAGTLYEATTEPGPNLPKVLGEAQRVMQETLMKGGGVGLDVTSEDPKLERIVRDHLAKVAQKTTAMGTRLSINDKLIASQVRAGYVRAALGTDGNRRERRAAAAQRRR